MVGKLECGSGENRRERARNRTRRNALNFKQAEWPAIRLAGVTSTACNSQNGLGYLVADQAAGLTPIFGGVAQLVRAADP